MEVLTSSEDAWVTYTVTGSDPYGLDGNNDGLGCEWRVLIRLGSTLSQQDPIQPGEVPPQKAKGLWLRRSPDATLDCLI